MAKLAAEALLGDCWGSGCAMIRSWHIFLAVILSCGSAGAQVASSNTVPPSAGNRLQAEQVHFLQCLAFVYDPSRWMSYNGALYFWPHTDHDLDQLEAIKTDRSEYVAFTNRLERHKLASQVLAGSGLNESWQKKLLLPYANTNQDLTPTIKRTVRWFPKYELVKNLGAGDALIADEEAAYFVLEYGRAASDALRTNAILVREGTKSFKSPSGEMATVEAFTNAGLNRDEVATLRRAAAAYAKAAESFIRSNSLPVAVATVADSKPKAQVSTSDKAAEFELHKARASDNSPYMQYLLAKDYLEGLGTRKDEKLGLEWMRRAAKNGSGDARTYLERSSGGASR